MRVNSTLFSLFLSLSLSLSRSMYSVSLSVSLSLCLSVSLSLSLSLSLSVSLSLCLSVSLSLCLFVSLSLARARYLALARTDSPTLQPSPPSLGRGEEKNGPQCPKAAGKGANLPHRKWSLDAQVSSYKLPRRARAHHRAALPTRPPRPASARLTCDPNSLRVSAATRRQSAMVEMRRG